MKEIIVPEAIEHKIFMIRSQKVMLGQDLAKLYGVTAGNLNKAVKRNFERFPEDFMFQLTKDEENFLRFQFGSLKRGQHAKYLPYAFTEQGVAMLSSVLRSSNITLSYKDCFVASPSYFSFSTSSKTKMVGSYSSQ